MVHCKNVFTIAFVISFPNLFYQINWNTAQVPINTKCFQKYYHYEAQRKYVFFCLCELASSFHEMEKNLMTCKKDKHNVISFLQVTIMPALLSSFSNTSQSKLASNVMHHFSMHILNIFSLWCELSFHLM